MRTNSQVARFLRREYPRVRDISSGLDDLYGGGPKMKEECGIFGIIGHEDASAKVALGLHALQHRGQEAVGIATWDGHQFHAERRMGLVSAKMSDEKILDSLPGAAGIGHTRYSTTGDTVLRNIQPLYADLDRGGLAIAHNGNLTNSRTKRAELIRKGCIFQTTMDSELFLQLAALSRGMTMVDKVIDSLAEIEGAYALTILTQHNLIGIRDPLGIRPLVLGKLGNAPVLASETCAFDLIGAEYVRDVRPGETVICHADGTVESRQITPEPTHARPCIFELIYFAKPNSFIDGDSVYELRKRLGRRLAKEAPVEADLISPIPDSGVPAAVGFSQKADLPFEMALIRSHYAERTFIQPSQKIREIGVARKHSANAGAIAGKRVVLVDDSLVRGTTSRKITRMLRDAGAKEVHFRIACPPIKFPDFYGINTPSRDELLASNHSIQEMRNIIGADSLEFLSLDGLYKAFGKGPRDDDDPAFTDHCFTGDYPTPLTDQMQAKTTAAIEQLSLLAESS
nr:amidophosphoribosyltransferase [Parvularcula sp. IMCC14364]